MKNKLDSIFSHMQFVSERKQIALMADGKPPVRISHRLLATNRSEMRISMQVYHGKSVFGGIAIGKISVFSKKEHKIVRVKINDTDVELARFEEARQTALTQLAALYDKACKEVGEANAAIFEVHQMMLEDDDFTDSVNNIITTQQVNAEYAVGVTADNFANMFSAMDKGYIRASYIYP